MMTLCKKLLSLCRIGIVSSLLLNTVWADDIDIFQSTHSNSNDNPNVLIILDNSPNWNNRFCDEVNALKTVVEGLDNRFNVGLMMQAESPRKGGYIRFPVLEMNSTNKAALAGLIGCGNGCSPACSTGLDKSSDRGKNAYFSKVFDEAYRYFAGKTVLTDEPKYDPRAVSGSNYISPIRAGSCAKNYIIFISNGYPSDSTPELNTASDDLTAFGGSSASTLIVPPDTGSGSRTSYVDEYARFMYRSDPPPPPTPANYHPFSSFPGANVITYTIDIDPATNGIGYDWWTPVLKSTARQGSGGNNGYFSVGGSGVSDITTSLVSTLKRIFTEIQSVNDMFASVSLPINSATQQTYLNQVYMGVFRPADALSPLWLGNLKQYKMAFSAGSLQLVDSADIPIASATTGFVVPDAISFWTKDSTFWSFATRFITNGGPSLKCRDGGSGPPCGGPASDCPDGPWVEKGGAAQRLRRVYATTPISRKIYVCNNAGDVCPETELALSNASTISSLDCSALDVVDPECTALKKWILGADNKRDENSNLSNDTDVSTALDVRSSIHGDILHSQPAVIDFGDNYGVWVFYGSNDGIFHALKGGQDTCTDPTSTTCPGTEQWGFIPPEFYRRLKRLRDEYPPINMPSRTDITKVNNKPYFMDGPIGIYRDKDTNKVYIFPTMRRGGRSIYALNVSNPNSPTVLWHRSNTDLGFSELGQTWSKPVATKILGDISNVVVFGAGYDPNVEEEVVSADPPMGRGIFFVNIDNGSIVKAFGNTDGIAHSIPGSIVPVDTDDDGFADCFYAADTGGNIWRIKYDGTTWSIFKLASLGGSGADNRKFLFEPDVVVYNKMTSPKKYAILIGSGNREKPLEETVVNRFYMLIDDGTNIAISPSDDLANASDGSVTLSASQKGWYMTLPSRGEKVTGNSTTIAGKTVFGTYTPTSLASPTYPGTSYPMCTGNLGVARRYAVNFRTAGSARILTNPEARSEEVVGGGMLPSPVAGIVKITTGSETTYQPFIMDKVNPIRIPIEMNPARSPIYWYKENSD